MSWTWFAACHSAINSCASLPHLGSDAEDVPDPERAKVARLNNQDVSPTIYVADLSQE